MINSKQKGKRGELELVKAINEHGYETRRSVQYNGQEGEADLIGLPGVHIECKRVERLNLSEAMAQAERDAKAGAMAAVFHRKTGERRRVTLDFDDFMQLYKNGYRKND